MKFDNHFLIAMPHMADYVFGKSLVYICEHDSKGAMGIIINKPIPSASVEEILNKTQLSRINPYPEIYFGGPIGMNQGFFLHSSDYKTSGTHSVSKKLAITSNTRIVDDIITGQGPNTYRIAIGYASWTAGQLNREFENGDWLIMPASSDFIFDTPDHTKWKNAAKQFGIDIMDITGHTGLA